MKTAIQASEILMTHYNLGYESETKTDGSPVTSADLASSAHICDRLSSTGIPIIEEESHAEDYALRSTWKRNWCIDPLDGTKEFIKHNGEFSVNIALIEDQIPTFGVISSPVERKLIAGAKNWGVFVLSFDEIDKTDKWEKLGAEPKELDFIALIGSRSHHSEATLQFIEQLKKKNENLTFIKKGSALKFFDLAQEKATIYPRFAPTMEWDIAAGQAILEALGGTVVDADTFLPLSYNKANLKNPSFIAVTHSFLNQFGVPGL